MGKSKDLAGLGGGALNKSLTVTGGKITGKLAGQSSGEALSLGSETTGEFGGIAISDGGTYPVRHWGSSLEFYTGNSAYSSATERMRIDASGRVTMPYQPAWRLQPNHTSNTTGTNHTIPFANVGGHQVYIQGGATVNSSGHVTVPVTGKYFMHVSWRQENYTGDYQISIMQNGLQRQRGGIWYSSQAYENINVTGVFHLAANDYVYVDVSGGGAGNAYNGYNDNLTFFHGYLIG